MNKDLITETPSIIEEMIRDKGIIFECQEYIIA